MSAAWNGRPLVRSGGAGDNLPGQVREAGSVQVRRSEVVRVWRLLIHPVCMSAWCAP